MLLVDLSLFIFDRNDLGLKRVTSFVELIDFFEETFLCGRQSIVRILDEIMRFLSELGHRLRVLERLDIRDDWLNVQLEVECEARNHRWHVIEFVKLVLKVLIDHRLSNILLFILGDQFRD